MLATNDLRLASVLVNLFIFIIFRQSSRLCTTRISCKFHGKSIEHLKFIRAFLGI